MIFSPNNPAKEWIAQEIAKQATQGPVRLCDLACGSGSIWKTVLLAQPSIQYLGSDTDARAIVKAQKDFAGVPNAHFEIADAQRPRQDLASYDVVTTLSSLEHVVRIDKFLDTVFAILKSGGIAYLNYDDGHFHSHDIKERIMVPVSQLLAKFGIEGPYMKEVRDLDVIQMIHERGGKVLQVRKHNLAVMKRFTKAYAKGRLDEKALQAWFDFENRLNEVVPSQQLAPLFGATIIVMEKP